MEEELAMEVALTVAMDVVLEECMVVIQVSDLEEVAHFVEEKDAQPVCQATVDADMVQVVAPTAEVPAVVIACPVVDVVMVADVVMEAMATAAQTTTMHHTRETTATKIIRTHASDLKSTKGHSAGELSTTVMFAQMLKRFVFHQRRLSSERIMLFVREAIAKISIKFALMLHSL